MREAGVTSEMLIAALEEARQSTRHGGGVSVSDVVAKLGVNERVVRGLIKPLVESGKATVVRVQRTAIDGASRWVPTYILKGVGREAN